MQIIINTWKYITVSKQIIITIIVVVVGASAATFIFFLWEFFSLTLADGFRWSLSDSKSPGLFSVFWPILIML